MKIEIDLEYIESLKEQIKRLESKNSDLIKKIDSLDETEIKQRAISISYELARQYLQTIFETLGFKSKYKEELHIESNIEHWLGKEWYTKRDRLNIIVGAYITNQVKEAFVNIGILPKDEK